MNTAVLNINEALKSRITRLMTGKTDGKCVLYVMSRDQRIRHNHALLAAQQRALARRLPLAVLFCLRKGRGYRAREHYRWMLAGLEQLEAELAQLNIPFLLLLGDPFERLSGCIRHLEPDAIYFDMNPLRGPRKLQQRVAKDAPCDVFVVDTHNIVPVRVASDKQEFAARTLRPKIYRHLGNYLHQTEDIRTHPHTWVGPVIKIKDLTGKIAGILEQIDENGQTDLQNRFPAGEKAARKHLEIFVSERLDGYAAFRNDPTKDYLSGLSPYLHFGQLSALEVVLRVSEIIAENPGLQADGDVLIEEMVVRKELSDNFCYFNSNYDNLSGAPDWAIRTLEKHTADERDFLYGPQELRDGKTHDPAWNAAQLQMVKTGKMHGYIRMYWAKKVLEWSESPGQAIETLIYLNDFYSIDGGDPNGYTGILWSVAGVHDRPWGERAVYGTVRSMVYDGLKRKFDIEAYINRMG